MMIIVVYSYSGGINAVNDVDENKLVSQSIAYC